MDADDIGWRLRLRVLDVQSALDIKGDAPLIPQDASAPKGRTHRTTVRASGGRHLIRKAVAGDYARIGLAAVEQGWLVRRSGTQHIVFTDPTGGGTFMLPSTGGKGRGYANAKAGAKRAGLDVEGL